MTEQTVRYLAGLVQKRLPRPALIISGPWGTGKTTLARIYAKALNCETPTDTGSPCWQCGDCLLFASKEHSDYREENSAAYGGIDEIRKLIAWIERGPSPGKTRILILDAAQGTSRAGFDALLKVVEDPPARVIVLLTIDAGRIPDALRSRCHQCEVKLLQTEIAIDLLRKVCGRENVAYEEPALELIALHSRGHPRDLLQNLDQVRIFGDKVTIEPTRAVLS